jgi:hypothetical protein
VGEFKDIRGVEAGGEKGTGTERARNYFSCRDMQRKYHVAPSVRKVHEPLAAAGQTRWFGPRSAVYSGIMNSKYHKLCGTVVAFATDSGK